MIGIDTNVLARSILNDDEVQSPLAKQKIRELINLEGVFISSYTLVELVWIMTIKKKNKKDIILVLKSLLETKGFFIGRENCVRKAVALFESGKADFCDYLIYSEAHEEKVKKIETFDKNFAKDLEDFVNLLKP